MLALKLLLALMSTTTGTLADKPVIEASEGKFYGALNTSVTLNVKGGAEATWKVDNKDRPATNEIKVTSEDDNEVVVTATVDGETSNPARVIFFDREAQFVLEPKEPTVGYTRGEAGATLNMYVGGSIDLFVKRTDEGEFGVVTWPNAEPNSPIKYDDDKPTRQVNRFRTITAVKEGAYVLEIASAINPRYKFAVNITIGPKPAEVTLTPPATRAKLSTTLTFNGLAPTVDYLVECEDPVFVGQEDPKKVTLKAGANKVNFMSASAKTLVLKVSEKDMGPGAKPQELRIRVDAAVDGFKLIPEQTTGGSLFLFQRQRYRAVPYAGNSKIDDINVKVVLDPSSAIAAPEGTAKFYFPADDLVEVEPISIDAESFKIKGTLRAGDLEVETPDESGFFGEAKLRVLRVEGFRNVNVQLVPMDDKMVEHLYGVQTRRQFYVYQVRINNNLLNQSGEPAQKSIVAYSASLGTGVTLEKWAKDARQRAKDPSTTVENGGWNPVTVTDYDSQFSHAPQLGTGETTRVEELGASGRGLSPVRGTLMVSQPLVFRLVFGGRKVANVASTFKVLNQTNQEVPDANLGASADGRSFVFRTATAGKFTILATTTYTPVVEGPDAASKSQEERQTDTFTSEIMVVDPAAAAKIFTYNPYRFAIMESTSSIRAESDGRNRAVSIMEAIGSIGTFILNVFEAKGQVPNMISNWSNVIIPGYKRYAPSLTEIQRANLIRDIMQPMEEIAYGQDIERTVFFPRGHFEGVIRGYKTRISAIDVSRYQIQIAVVDTKATINSGGGQSGVTAPGRGGVGGGGRR